jgi:hypothetical protein
MAETTFEIASRCPKCQEPCAAVKVTKLPQGGKVHVFECRNDRCTDFENRRIVQTNPDGSIPQAHKGPKAFPKINHKSEQAQRARDQLRILDYKTTHPGLTDREIIRILGG